MMNLASLALMGSMLATTEGMANVPISVDCAVAIAVSLKEVEQDQIGQGSGKTPWEFVRANHRFVRCTQQKNFINVEFLASTSDEVRGGVIYYRVNLDDGSVVEKQID